jgi:hypothetical protein
VVHGQDHLVRVPVGEEVHRQRDAERDQHARLAADQETDADENRGEDAEQKSRLDVAHGAVSLRGRRKA